MKSTVPLNRRLNTRIRRREYCYPSSKVAPQPTPLHCAGRARDPASMSRPPANTAYHQKELIELLIHDLTIHSLMKSVRFTFGNSKHCAALEKSQDGAR